MSIFDNNGLILVPSGHKSGKLYAQRPINGGGDLAFSNASVRTRVNKNGVLEMVPAGMPRLEWIGGRPRMLMEPAATNLLLYSVDVAQSYFEKYGADIVGNASTLGAEICTNGSFESDLNGWSASVAPWNPQVFERNTTNPISGTGDMHIIGNASNFSGAAFPVNLISGKKYRLTFKYRKVGSIQWTVKLASAAIPTSAQISGTFSQSLNATSNTNISLVFSPKQTSNAYIIFYDYNTAAGEIYIDDVSFREIETYDDPMGSKHAYKLQENTATSEHYLYRGMPLTNGVKYTVSFFAKAGERSFIYFSESQTRFTYFNLNNGTVGAKNAGHAATMELVNGFWRCSVTFTSSSTGINVCIGLASADNVYIYSGNGSSGAYIFGLQFCQLGYKTSLIYDGTEGSTKTRAVDSATLADLFTKDITGSNTWSILLDIHSFSTPQSYSYCLALKSGAIIQATLGVASAGRFVFKDEKNSLWPWVDAQGLSGSGKLSITYDGTFVRLYVNGAKNPINYSPAISFSTIDNLEWIGGAAHRINALVVLPECLSEAEASQLTTS